jgi:hypothetical protein
MQDDISSGQYTAHMYTDRWGDRAAGVCVLCVCVLSGGGRKIIRVEVSLDGGHLWRQAEITRHETPTPAGTACC